MGGDKGGACGVLVSHRCIALMRDMIDPFPVHSLRTVGARRMAS